MRLLFSLSTTTVACGKNTPESGTGVPHTQKVSISSVGRSLAYLLLPLFCAAGIGGCVPAVEDDTLEDDTTEIEDDTTEVEDDIPEVEDDIPEIEDDFEEDLSKKYGCGDVTFYAFDEANEVMLSLRVDGLLIAAFDAGEDTTTEFDLPVEDVTLIVEHGRNISSAICNDLIENGGPVVLESYTATSGTARITVRPGVEHEYDDVRGDLHLEEVIFASDADGETITLTSFGIEDVSIGWFAG
jgi:hypothetical protein